MYLVIIWSTSRDKKNIHSVQSSLCATPLAVCFFPILTAFILWNNSALTNFWSLLHVVFHVRRAPRFQNAGTPSLSPLWFVLSNYTVQLQSLRRALGRRVKETANFSPLIVGLAGTGDRNKPPERHLWNLFTDCAIHYESDWNPYSELIYLTIVNKGFDELYTWKDCGFRHRFTFHPSVFNKMIYQVFISGASQNPEDQFGTMVCTML
jgi:hypothetical protein